MISQFYPQIQVFRKSQLIHEKMSLAENSPTAVVQDFVDLTINHLKTMYPTAL
jgi:hypothetical protein